MLANGDRVRLLEHCRIIQDLITAGRIIPGILEGPPVGTEGTVVSAEPNSSLVSWDGWDLGHGGPELPAGRNSGWMVANFRMEEV